MTDTRSGGAASRRAFLAAGLVAPAAAALVPASLQAQATPTGSARHALKIGAVTYNIAKDWDVPTIIKNFTAAGLDGVELRTTHAHGVEPSLSAAARAEVRKQFEGSAVKIAGLGTTCEYHSPDPGRCPQEHRRDQAMGAAGQGPRVPEREGAAQRPAEGRARGEDARADRPIDPRVRSGSHRSWRAASSSRCTAPRPSASLASSRC